MISTCPNCHEDVLLPGGVHPESRVRCPLCQEEYLLADVLRKLPPALILVEAIPSSSSVGFDVGSSDTAHVLGAQGGTDFGGVGVLVAEPETARATFEPVKTAARSTSGRAKRAPKNPVFELLKVVGGGAVGLFMAQMILWWLPGTWRRDPFDFAPTLAKYSATRMLVPKDFWPKDGGAGGLAAPPTNGNGANSHRAPLGDIRDASKTDWNQVIGGNEDDRGAANGPPPSRPTKSRDMELISGDTDSGTGPTADRASGDPFFELPDFKADLPSKPIVPLEPVKDDGNSKQPTSASESGSEPDLEPVPTTDAPKGELTATRLKGVSSASMADVTTALRTALGAEKSWTEGAGTSGPERRKMAEDVYASLAGLGEVLACLDATVAQSDRSFSEIKVRELVSRISADATLMRVVELKAPQWMDDSKRSANGLALIGTVTEVASAGELEKARLKVDGKSPRLVTVVRLASAKASAPWEVDGKYLVVGLIVDQPSKRIAGFDGDEALVVWGGFPTAVYP